ncbi:response regulator [Thalassotalea atypica]|uniref:response regulator n=1 Tax=Thalassotalea atypica TaxID=2054316 RepID=UPI002574662A|nr:response regulator [Thalassotalea atypica]
MNSSILIVEDELKIAELLADYFRVTGYSPHIIQDGNTVIDWVKDNQPEAILLDIMLPHKSGVEICKEIRQFSQVPILMVTAKVEEIDRLLGLELGADDYICKPFSPREVVARVKAVLRRTDKTVTRDTELTLDEQQLVVSYKGQKVMLTAVEFKLFKQLAAYPSRIFSREQIMEVMYSDYRIVNNRTVDSHVKKLRKKLDKISQGKELIQSVYGAGYRLVIA